MAGAAQWWWLRRFLHFRNAILGPVRYSHRCTERSRTFPARPGRSRDRTVAAAGFDVALGQGRDATLSAGIFAALRAPELVRPRGPIVWFRTDAARA